MEVQEIMTPDPECCTPESTLRLAAELMVSNDCGEIPVVESLESMLPIGVITDRDITCRSVARGLNPLTMIVADCMTTPCITVMPDTPLNECRRIMEDHQIRRVPVVDAGGACCGIVALADIARNGSKKDTAKVVKEVSVRSFSASAGGR